MGPTLATSSQTAATIIGFEIGLFGTQVVNAVIVVIVVTTVILFAGMSYFGKRIAMPVVGHRELGAVLVIPSGDLDAAPRLLALGARLATADAGQVIPLHVGLVAGAAPVELDRPRATLGRLQEIVRDSGIAAEEVLRFDDSVASGVRATVAEQQG